ncbi:MAG: hypothetical protein GXX99_02300 [Clostridiales bacterium]|nr:hypothetical protein [Clostridiales bacterium]
MNRASGPELNRAEYPPEADGQPAGKKGRKKADKKRARGDKKGRRGFWGLLALVVLIFFAAGFLVASVKKDLGGVRSKLIETVNLLDPAYADLVAREQQVELLEAGLATREQQVALLEEALNARALLLDEREAAALSRELERLPIYRRNLDEDKQEEIRALGKTYANMDAEKAASIMGELYNVEDMATILYYMSSRSAAAVLEQMDQKLAAQITDELLKN